MNKLFTLFILSFLFQVANAQRDTVIVYFKDSGKIVDSKDSADYTRMVLPPDSNVDKNLYRMYEFYPNGKYKTLATSVTGPRNLTFDGTYISYFPNGHRKLVVQYKNGIVISDVTNYYPNGKIYNIFKVNYEYNINHYYYYYYGSHPYLKSGDQAGDNFTNLNASSFKHGEFLFTNFISVIDPSVLIVMLIKTLPLKLCCFANSG